MFAYTCECNDVKCRRTMAITEVAYRRLSVSGNVVHVDHVDRRGDARAVAKVNDSVVKMGTDGPVGVAAYAVTLVVRTGLGVRAW